MPKLTLPLNHPLKTSVGLGDWSLRSTDDGKTLHVGVNGKLVHIKLHQEDNGIVVCVQGLNQGPVATLAVPYSALGRKA